MIRRTPSRTLVLILAATFLGLAVLLIFGLWDWLREAVVIPVMYFLWLMSRIANSIDQQVLWIGLFVLALFGIAQVYFFRPRRAAEEPVEESAAPSQGRVKYWLVYVNLMLVGVYNRSFFSEELKRLILSILAERERQLPVEVEKRIRSGDLTVPPQVLTFFTSPRIRPAATLTEKARRTVEALINPAARENRPEKLEDLQSVIAFLEEQMERK
jgi:hypothetical protein